ncbi:hypothetical protein CFP65_3272 [Kitasatospora sp. MMS16-BH015]|uniref:hypothetical protein n=1 Tax=Kitasatospora sp. MMS16-BH015 TaxID=2018025 RepID=UPI000CA300AD|nr:hypothetical protein [Kitasatospora sp. MMS16-BH015]AUG78073.1 hypothetical protein CFP65_3272 [Kitasatospora sp. MMS16-BH015]
MIRAHLHPDRHTVRLDATDAAERLLDTVALAFAADEQGVADLLRELAEAADHHRARRGDPRATEHGRESAAAALDAYRDDTRQGIRHTVERRRADLLDTLPATCGLLAADLTWRTSLALADQLRALAAQTVAGSRAIELESEA